MHAMGGGGVRGVKPQHVARDYKKAGPAAGDLASH